MHASSFLVSLLSLAAMVTLATPAASALEIGTYQVTYDIQSSGQVLETLEISFTAPLNASTENVLTLGDVSGISVKAGSLTIPVQTEQVGNDLKVTFATPAGTQKLVISFTAHSLVFQNGGVSQFFTELSPPPSQTLEIIAQLPKGFVLYRDIIFPEGAVVSGDGERIAFTWTFADHTGSVPISLQFEPAFKTDQFLLPGVIVLAAAAVAGAFLFFRRKTKREFLLTFFEDERKLILALREERVCYQNTLERRLGFSRAKMTRMVQKLGRKGLIKKEKAGRTNRLTWTG